MKIAPYLHFYGNAQEAMDFYVEVFNAKVLFSQKYSDAPAEYTMEGSSKDWIMHAYIKRGDNDLMFSDVPKDAITFGTNNYISVNCTSEAEVDEVYKNLSVGAQKIGMPLQDTFRGAKFAGFVDKFGVARYLNWDRPKA